MDLVTMIKDLGVPVAFCVLLWYTNARQQKDFKEERAAERDVFNCERKEYISNIAANTVLLTEIKGILAHLVEVN